MQNSQTMVILVVLFICDVCGWNNSPDVSHLTQKRTKKVSFLQHSNTKFILLVNKSRSLELLDMPTNLTNHDKLGHAPDQSRM